MLSSRSHKELISCNTISFWQLPSPSFISLPPLLSWFVWSFGILKQNQSHGEIKAAVTLVEVASPALRPYQEFLKKLGSPLCIRKRELRVTYLNTWNLRDFIQVKKRAAFLPFTSFQNKSTIQGKNVIFLILLKAKRHLKNITSQRLDSLNILWELILLWLLMWVFLSQGWQV